jgi:hypothetical protein
MANTPNFQRRSENSENAPLERHALMISAMGTVEEGRGSLGAYGHRPVSHPRSSRGSSPAGYPAEPLVSYQINRQLSGWNLPPLVIRAFGAHCQEVTLRQSIDAERSGITGDWITRSTKTPHGLSDKSALQRTTNSGIDLRKEILTL